MADQYYPSYRYNGYLFLCVNPENNLLDMDMTGYHIGYLFGYFLATTFFIGTIYYFLEKPRIPYYQAVFNRYIVIASLILSPIVYGNSILEEESVNDYNSIIKIERIAKLRSSCEESFKTRKIAAQVASKICLCSFDEIQKVYTYKEFKTIQWQTPDIKIKNIFTACARKQS
jgi:hypothetical protein